MIEQISLAGRDKRGVMGIDVGTTGCKAVIYNAEGNVESSAYKEYSLKMPRAGWMELDPDDIWQSVKAVSYTHLDVYKRQDRDRSVAGFKYDIS